MVCETLRLTPTWVTHTAGQGSSPIPLLMKELQAQESEARRSKVLDQLSTFPQPPRRETSLWAEVA